MKSGVRNRRVLSNIFLFLIFSFIQCRTSGENDITARKKLLAEEVKNEFLFAWQGYKSYAWGHDVLNPVSRTYRDWHGTSLYITPVDALDTMILMDLKDEAEQTKKLILDNLNFDLDIYVKAFEINIRLLGGLLSAYQLVRDPKFLLLAEDLGKRLLPVFDSPTGLPYVNVNLRTGQTEGATSNPAEIGSYLVEFAMLSKLTGNPVYLIKARQAVEVLYSKRSAIGLVGSTINVESGEWGNRQSHISGGIDSYYEYLLKGSILLNDQDLKAMWDESLKAIQHYLADSTDHGLWFGRADMDSGQRTATLFGSLEAFFPAVLALSGNLRHAEDLQSSCYKMWNLHGIEPEILDYEKMKVIYPPYLLRPEIIESAYYLYHFTKKENYITMGETFLEDLKQHCRIDIAYTQLLNVITKEKDDAMDSFFFAETLKYLYLLFAEEDALDFESVIFNTEAHPMFIVFMQ